MFSRVSFDTRTLSVRLIIGFIAVIVATLLAVGIPTLVLIRGDLERQAQARLAQGASATQAIYAARQRETRGLVNLAAQRPTLHQLIVQKDKAALASYLETIRSAPHLDFLIAFDVSNQLLAYAQLPPGWTEATAQSLLSPSATPAQLLRVTTPNATVLTLVASEPVYAENGALIGTIAGGLVINDEFLADLRQETGLDQSIYADGARVAATLPALPMRADQVSAGLLSSGPDSFFIEPITLAPGVVDILALPANDIVAAQTRVVQVLLAGAVALTLLAATLGYGLAHRVTAPLRQLVSASEGIGRGDLNTPIPSPRGVVEVIVLARTLERMRHRLRAAYEELERAKTWSENLIASLAEGVLTIDATGRITSFSPGAERILGWRASDVIGRSLPTVLQSGNDAAPALVTPGSARRQVVSTREGRQIVLHLTSGAVTPHDDGSAEQALVFRDVTEEEESLRLREFFLANVSHELKTPLSSLRASIELLATELPELTRDEETELVNSLWLGTMRLEELVDNLLSSASIHSGQFQVQLRPTDLESVVEEVLLTTRPLLILRGQRLEPDIPPGLPPVWADPRRLGQVLVNLISNASKYGPADAPIKVRAQSRSHQLLVQVIDRGPGISPDIQPLLFQPFKRSDDAAHGGVGLGLSIVRTIIERHGGEVGVNGSTFWFTLNLCEET